MAQSDFVLKIESINGEVSTDNAIEVRRWWQSVDAASDPYSGAQIRRVNVAPLKVLKRVDKATAALIRASIGNALLSKVTLECRKGTGPGQEPYLTVELKDARISKVDFSTAAPDDPIIMEEVTIVAKKCEWIYRPQGSEGGMGGQVRASYEWMTN